MEKRLPHSVDEIIGISGSFWRSAKHFRLSGPTQEHLIRNVHQTSFGLPQKIITNRWSEGDGAKIVRDAFVLAKEKAVRGAAVVLPNRKNMFFLCS